MNQSLGAITAAPPPPLAQFLLRRLARQWSAGSMTIDLPRAESSIMLGDPRSPPAAHWSLGRWRALRRVLFRGDLGLADGYVAGDWDSRDLAGLLTAVAVNYDALSTERRSLAGALAQRLRHARNRNSRSGSRRNILAHYDLGNAFYEAWLDPSMTYSSALLADPDEPLEQGQRRKYQRLARLADVRPGCEVLEIGCGWGGFAQYAAGELGAKVTAITLSPAQQEYAQARLFRAGLAERVEVQLRDYRDIRGRFDSIVSIEMFEAVGEAYWPRYFQTLTDSLKPSGAAALQVITLREDLFDDYRRRPDFIQLEVFPGGMLPTPSRLLGLATEAGLRVSPQGLSRLGQSYAVTLRRWREAFEAAWPDIRLMGFDERFHRLWRYYLAYCEAGFASGRTDVVHLGLRKL